MLIKIPRRRINISSNIIFRFFKFLLSNKIKNDDEIARFEKEFAKYVGCKYAVSTYSGKQALYLIFESLDFENGDEILIPSYTASSVPMSVMYAGLKPVFIDVNPTTFNINTKLIERRISKRTKAIIATHIHGLPCDMESILKIAKKHNLVIIEDCAHSIGAKINNRNVGTFGKASFFSFGLGKHISTFGGGMIVSNDRKFIENVKNLMKQYDFPNSFELIFKFWKFVFSWILTIPLIFSFTLYPIMYVFGNDFLTQMFETKLSKYKLPKEYRKRFSNLQASIGLNEMISLENNLNQRINNAMTIKDKLESIKKIKLQDYPKTFRHTYLDFAVYVKNRKKTIRDLLVNGVDAQKTWLDDCSSLSIFKQNGTNCPVAKKLADGVLYLPIYSDMKEAEINYIIKILKRCVR